MTHTYFICWGTNAGISLNKDRVNSGRLTMISFNASGEQGVCRLTYTDVFIEFIHTKATAS